MQGLYMNRGGFQFGLIVMSRQFSVLHPRSGAIDRDIKSE